MKLLLEHLAELRGLNQEVIDELRRQRWVCLPYVMKNLQSFQNLTASFAKWAIRNGYADEVRKHIGSFEKID